MQIPRIDARQLEARDPDALDAMRQSATDVGFATVHGTALDGPRVREVIETYRAFFRRPMAEKARIDMARTGANRGWGAAGSEQVDPAANPDFKQYFDCGFTLPDHHPLASMPVYAPNLWPDRPAEFERIIKAYYDDALEVAKSLLRAVSLSLGRPADAFGTAFEAPMALLRGNYYPPRPDTAGERDFGIATHTDYGCLTLLATDGSSGLEVRARGGGWIPLAAPPGEFIINFGEMLEFWTGREVVATPHRVIGGAAARISVPLFVNPAHDTNVAPPGSGVMTLAGDHMARRFSETYIHLKTDWAAPVAQGTRIAIWLAGRQPEGGRMKNAAVILGIIGGILGMLTGFFAYGYVEFVGWFDTQVQDQDLFSRPVHALRVQIIGIAAPVLAIAGGAMAHSRPSLGAALLVLSVAGMIWAFGFGVFTMFPIVMTGLAALFALLGLATKEPGTL